MKVAWTDLLMVERTVGEMAEMLAVMMAPLKAVLLVETMAEMLVWLMAAQTEIELVEMLVAELASM